MIQFKWYIVATVLSLITLEAVFSQIFRDFISASSRPSNILFDMVFILPLMLVKPASLTGFDLIPVIALIFAAKELLFAIALGDLLVIQAYSASFAAVIKFAGLGHKYYTEKAFSQDGMSMCDAVTDVLCINLLFYYLVRCHSRHGEARLKMKGTSSMPRALDILKICIAIQLLADPELLSSYF